MIIKSCARDIMSCARDIMSCARDNMSCARDNMSCARDLMSCARDNKSCARDNMSCARHNFFHKKNFACPKYTTVGSNGMLTSISGLQKMIYLSCFAFNAIRDASGLHTLHAVHCTKYGAMLSLFQLAILLIVYFRTVAQKHIEKG